MHKDAHLTKMCRGYILQPLKGPFFPLLANDKLIFVTSRLIKFCNKSIELQLTSRNPVILSFTLEFYCSTYCFMSMHSLLGGLVDLVYIEIPLALASLSANNGALY